MKIASSESQGTRRPRRSEPVILFTISGQMFAISASAMHEIRNTDSLSAAAVEISCATVPKVRHLLRRGNSTLFVVSGFEHFGLPPSRAEHAILLRHSRIGVLVEAIDRMEGMTVLLALPPGFSGPERSWYRGITLVSGNAVPVINPSGFLNEQEFANLDAAAMSALQKNEAHNSTAAEQAQ
jgi:chemotaxis signal transduction protein